MSTKVSNGQEPYRESSTGRIAAACLIAFFSSLVFGYLWWGRFEYFKSELLFAVYVLSAAALAFSHWRFKDRLPSIGLRLDNLGHALRAAALPTLALAAVISLLGMASGMLQIGHGRMAWIYLPWALLQQYVLQAFILRRFQTLWQRDWAAILSAAFLFALFHLPNYPLMAASLAGALVWCRLFVQRSNLLSVGLSHALLGILLALFFKFEGMDQFRVGKDGYPYTSYGKGVHVAGGYDAAGRPIIATLPGQDRASPSLVRIFQPDGTPIREWLAFPELRFSGNLAMGDLGFGPGDEIAVAPGPGVRSPPQVRIFDLRGRQLSQFQLPTQSGYGAWVAIAEKRVVATPGPGPGRLFQSFEFSPDGKLLRRWGPVAVGGFENSGRATLLPGPQGSGSEASRLVLWPSLVSVNQAEVWSLDAKGRPAWLWQSFPTVYGLNMAQIRLGQERQGFVAAPGAVLGHPAHLKVFDSGGLCLHSFIPFRSQPSCGSNLAAVDVDGDGIDEVIAGDGDCPGVAGKVRIISLASREVIHEWSPAQMIQGRATGVVASRAPD